MEFIAYQLTLNPNDPPGTRRTYSKTLKKSKYKVFVNRFVRGWNWKVVPPCTEAKNLRQAKNLPRSHPRCLTDEASLRAHIIVPQ